MLKTEVPPQLLISSWSINVLWHFEALTIGWRGWITAEYWSIFLPDNVIKRTHPSDHKKASLNINISSEHLPKNTAALGVLSLKSVRNWDWAGNKYWCVKWELPTILPAGSQKDPKWHPCFRTETSQIRGLPARWEGKEQWMLLLSCCWAALSLQIRSSYWKRARAVIHMASHTFQALR